MKKILLASLLFLCVACESANGFGSCIGIADKEDPRFEYKVSTRNVLIGLVFSQSLVVPGYILLEEIKCPVGEKHD